MKITEKTKMKELARIEPILACSRQELLTEIKRFDVPTKVAGIEVIDASLIGLEDMLDIWNVKTEQDVLNLTAKCFLGLEPKDIPNLPLIDFLRLSIHLQDTATKAAELFRSLKREPKDGRVAAILEDFQTSDFGIIDRFCQRPPYYDHEYACKIAWTIVYGCFAEDTKKYDIEEKMEEIREEDLKHR